MADSICRALAQPGAVRQINAAHAGLRRKPDILAALGFTAFIAKAAGKFQCRFAFRRLIMQAGKRRAPDKLAARRAAYREEICRHAVAESNGARFIENHCVNIAAGFYGLAGHGNNVKPGYAVHTSYADCRKQPADSCWYKADR